MSALGGIDLGGTKIQAVVVDERFEVLGQSRVPTPTTGGPPDVAEAMAGALREAAEAAGQEPSGLGAVGVGAPGAIDDATGVLSGAPNLPGWRGSFPLRETLEQALGTPVALGNDVTVATDAEFHLGAAKEFGSLLGVFWGTGVGGGIVLDGRSWTGRGSAGEIGHVCVEIGGAKCPCGRRGCMEAYAGRGAMEIRARKLHEEGRRTALFEIMRERDDELAHELIDRAVRALGAGVASVVNVLDVEAVVIGGGLGLKLGEPYAERIRVAMSPHLFVVDRPPAIRLAALGDLGGAIGAALLAAGRAHASV